MPNGSVHMHPPHTRGLTLKVALVLLFVATVPAAARDEGVLSAPSLVDETNDVRVQAGLGALTLNSQLSRAAQAKADDMAARGYFEHTTPEGHQPWDLIAAAGYQYQAAAENLAVGLTAGNALIAAWMASPLHRQNILNKRYTEIGVGIARGRYKGQDTVFVVQLLGTPRRTPARPSAW